MSGASAPLRSPAAVPENAPVSLTAPVFDIKELAVFDGPGVRVTVFFKGCPLRCAWCHNPESWSFSPQLLANPNGCSDCGKCAAVCPSPGRCTACARCVAACPARLRSLCGIPYTPEVLARVLRRHEGFLQACGGGITFSGGEPLAHAAFLRELLALLPGLHCAAETSGHCPKVDFLAVTSRLNLVLMDLKLIDPAQHRRYTGVDNALILENLRALKASRTPFIIRIPLIPGVTDTEENLSTAAALLRGAPRLERVELLPYYKAAGAKYSMAGLHYSPPFDTERPPNADTSFFRDLDVPCLVL